jgi:hypothetical protein
MVALSTLFQLVNSAQIVRASPPELKGTLVAVDMVRNKDRCADFKTIHPNVCRRYSPECEFGLQLLERTSLPTTGMLLLA